MDKLSSILSSSPRVKSVDLSDAPPLRPGTPSFGRPVGTTSVKDRFTISSTAKDAALKETLGFKNSKEARQSKIAEDVSRKFFETRLQPKEDAVVAVPVLEPEPMEASFEEIPVVQSLPGKTNDLAPESLQDFLQE